MKNNRKSTNTQLWFTAIWQPPTQVRALTRPSRPAAFCSWAKKGTRINNRKEPGEGDTHARNRHSDPGWIDQGVRDRNVPVQRDKAQVVDGRVTEWAFKTRVELTVTLPKVPAALHGPHCAEGHHSHSHQEVRTGQRGDQGVGWRMQLLEVENCSHHQEVSKYSPHSSKDEHRVEDEAGAWWVGGFHTGSAQVRVAQRHSCGRRRTAHDSLIWSLETGHPLWPRMAFQFSKSF